MQHWKKFWEMGCSTYGLYWSHSHRYCLELNCTGITFCINVSQNQQWRCKNCCFSCAGMHAVQWCKCSAWRPSCGTFLFCSFFCTKFTGWRNTAAVLFLVVLSTASAPADVTQSSVMLQLQILFKVLAIPIQKSDWTTKSFQFWSLLPVSVLEKDHPSCLNTL